MTSDPTPDAHRTIAQLRTENDDLRTRIGLAEEALATLREEAMRRRAEVRSLVEDLPAAMSRRTMVTAMLRDVRHHPDKSGVVRRALAKVGRAPRKIARSLHLTA